MGSGVYCGGFDKKLAKGLARRPDNVVRFLGALMFRLGFSLFPYIIGQSFQSYS